MIDQLKLSKIPAIKGEILHSAEVCLPGNHQESFLSSDGKTIITENYRELIERKVVSLDDYSKIFDHCHKQNMDFVVSVYDHEGVQFAKDNNAVALKVSSSNITHYPLIASIVKTKLPIIIDTGHATIGEAVRAVEWCRSLGEERIIVEHSPPAPPTSISQHNMNLMLNLSVSCQSFYGLSDHHHGTEMIIAATAMGAHIIEKGVCPVGMENDQDVNHAMCIDDVSSIYAQMLNVFNALGDGNDRNRNSVESPYKSRMCLVAKYDLDTNSILTLGNVTFAFPPVGIGCEYWPEVSGKAVIVPLKKGDVITWGHIQDLSC